MRQDRKHQIKPEQELNSSNVLLQNKFWSKNITGKESEGRKQKAEIFVEWKYWQLKRKLEFQFWEHGTHLSPNNFICVSPSKKSVVI